MNKGEFVHKVQALTGIQDQDRAEKLTQTVLGTLCGRITGDEAEDLAAQLPQGIEEMCKGPVLTSLLQNVKGPEKLDRDQFVEKIRAKGELPDVQSAEQVTKAVFTVIKEQISEGEAEDVAAQLPQRLKVMWLES